MSEPICSDDGRTKMTPAERAFIEHPAYRAARVTAIRYLEEQLDDEARRKANDSEDDHDSIDDDPDIPYIPEFTWRDLPKWPAFIWTWPGFIWFCICDTFENNPYKLPALVYIALFIMLLWFMVAKWVIIIRRLIVVAGLPYKDWTRETEQEVAALKDMAISVFPNVVQFVLFLFPPLLGNL